MGNTNTPHSRALRAKTATARRKAIVEAGGMRIELLLLQKPAEALRLEMTRTGETATEVISRKLLEKNESA